MQTECAAESVSEGERLASVVVVVLLLARRCSIVCTFTISRMVGPVTSRTVSLRSSRALCQLHG